MSSFERQKLMQVQKRMTEMAVELEHMGYKLETTGFFQSLEEKATGESSCSLLLSKL